MGELAPALQTQVPMNRIARMNLVGLTTAALCVLAASTVFMGCGPAPVNHAPIAGVPSQTTGPISAPVPTAPTDLSGIPTAELDALLRTYGGTLYPDYGSGEEQEYSFTLSRANQASQPGRVYVQIAFTSANLRFTSLAVVEYTPGVLKTFIISTSEPQFNEGVNPSSNFLFHLRLVTRAQDGQQNVFDPALSTIRIVDNVSFRYPDDSADPVRFARDVEWR